MIVDSAKGFERYIKLHKGFDKVCSYIKSTDFSKIAVGEYAIDGKDIYCKIWEGDAIGVEIPKPEIHDSYIDIHLLIEGSETIGVIDRRKCYCEEVIYDEKNDIAFLNEMPENFISLAPDNLAILFPHDAHAPLIGEGKIKKAIFKVKTE